METGRSLQEEFIITPQAKEAVLFANSASFLLDRLRRDGSVSYVAQSLETREILDRLKDMAGQAPKQPTDLVRAYVFLVALALKEDFNDVRDELLSIGMDQIEWAGQIRGLLLDQQIPTKIEEVRFSGLESNAPSTSTTNHTFDFRRDGQ